MVAQDHCMVTPASFDAKNANLPSSSHVPAGYRHACFDPLVEIKKQVSRGVGQLPDHTPASGSFLEPGARDRRQLFRLSRIWKIAPFGLL